MIYRIEFNEMTGTYRVYKSYHPVELRKTKTRAMNNFMRVAKTETKGNIVVYRR